MGDSYAPDNEKKKHLSYYVKAKKLSPALGKCHELILKNLTNNLVDDEYVFTKQNKVAYQRCKQSDTQLLPHMFIDRY